MPRRYVSIRGETFDKLVEGLPRKRNGKIHRFAITEHASSLIDRALDAAGAPPAPRAAPDAKPDRKSRNPSQLKAKPKRTPTTAPFAAPVPPKRAPMRTKAVRIPRYKGPPSFEQIQAVRREVYLRVLHGRRSVPTSDAEARRCSEAFAAELRRRGWLAEEGRAA